MYNCWNVIGNVIGKVIGSVSATQHNKNEDRSLP